MRSKSIIFLTSLIFALFILWLINVFSYSFTVTIIKNGVELNALSYYFDNTPVQQLRIIDENGVEVVRFSTITKNPMMHTVTIKEGINTFSDLYLDKYSISYPKGVQHSFLKGHKYKAIITWSLGIKQNSLYFTLN